MLLSAGSRLGPYEILAPIGVGGMGEVYRALDTKLGRDVAIKIVSERFAHDRERLSRFQREAHLLAALNHPHIAAIHGLEEADGSQFLVLELVEGETLADRLKARGSGLKTQGLPVDEAIAIARQVVDALQAAHEKGIVHRDLKPANIAFTAAGQTKILDFGLAQQEAGGAGADGVSNSPTMTVGGTQAGLILGTAAYMSPEQARGLRVDRRTDIWSFGCVLFEMLSGTRAFSGDTAIDILAAVVQQEPHWAALPADLPRSIRHVLECCLQRDVDKRARDMLEVRGLIEKAVQHSTLAKGYRTLSHDLASVAVLPFANLSADPEGEYFGDGLAEEIINALAQAPGLRVIARTSSFAFKGKQEDIRRIADVLDVAHVLEGSVRKAGARIRVTAQLISARDGSQVWSKRYDRDLVDVFTIQDEISQSIASTLHLALGADFVGRQRPTASLPAYEAFLRARYYMVVKADFAGSFASLQEAIAVDPEFALAHCGLGRHFLMAFTNQTMPAHEAVILIRRHVQRALDLDPALPEAHGILGCVAAMYDYNWAEAEREFSKAFSQGPPSHEVRIQRVNFFLAHVGHGLEAVEEMEQALRDDPFSHWTIWCSAVALRSVGRDTEADARYKQLLDMDIGPVMSAILGVVLSGNHLARGQIGEALHYAETGHARYPALPAGIGQLAGLLARTGSEERSRALLNQLAPETKFGVPFGLALHSLAVGDLDACAQWLEKAIEQRDLWVSFLLNVGNMGGRVMWSSPHWPRLARLMNLPEARPMM